MDLWILPLWILPLWICTGNWRDVQYRGDWLKRPIASNEVATLVRPLVWVSERLNLAIGLTGPLSPEEEQEPVEDLGQQAVRALRQRGFRQVADKAQRSMQV